MILWLLMLFPVLAGTALLLAGPVLGRGPVGRKRRILGGGGTGTLLVTAGLALTAALPFSTTGVGRTAVPTSSYQVGDLLQMLAVLDGPAPVVAVLVPLVAAVVVLYAAWHEPERGLVRLTGLLVIFVGTMELLVIAGDLLTLTVAFEMVGGISWALISQRWWDPEAPRSAAHAFNATRFGSLGLFLASGAAYASTTVTSTAGAAMPSLAFADLDGVTGPALHVMVAGILLAAVAKSGQVPFSPWLFSAMAGPTSVSALLHSSTMVAAGAYTLIRLHPVLDRASWFGPTTIAIGLVTALAAGVVALLQSHVKKLLAASTSAQYGLMLIAVGAGYPGVAAIHLVVHAVFKAQLFLSAGIAMEAVGTPTLGRMRLGRQLRITALLTVTGTLALAAVPPLGGAWSKEEVAAAAGHVRPLLAMAVILAGGLSAAYATRFHLLAFGPLRGSREDQRSAVIPPSGMEQTALGILAVGTVALGVLWVPSVHDAAAAALGAELPGGPPWQMVASLVVLVLAAYMVWTADRMASLGHVGTTGWTRQAGDWLGLPRATLVLVVTPAFQIARAAAWVDDHVIDAGVGAVGRGAHGVTRLLAGRAGRAGVEDRVDAGVHAVADLGSRLALWVTRRPEAAIDAGVRAVAGTGLWVASWSTRWVERGVDAAVYGAAFLVDRAGTDARRTHTGMVHQQFVVIAIGVLCAVAAALVRI